MNPASSRARFINEDISPFTRSVDYEAQKRKVLVEWINSLVPNACLPVKSSSGELRASLLDGVLLCQILSKLKPNFVNEGADPCRSLERLKRFLAAIAEMGLPGFEISDVEKGSMKPVLDCLYALKEKYMPNFVGSKFAPYSPASTESQSGVFQKRQGFYLDVPVSRISEMVKSNSLDNAPTQSLLSVVNGILDESIERRNTEIPQRVACLLRKVVQEIERRLATQAEHLRMQNSLFKGREEKYQSRIRVLEALATGTSEESEIVMNELQRLKTEKKKMEQKKTSEDTNAPLGKKDLAMSKKALEQTKIGTDDSVIAQLKKEKDQIELELSALKEDLAMSKKALEQMKIGNDDDSVIAQLRKEKDQIKLELSTLKQELEKFKILEMEHPTNDEDKEVVEVKNVEDQSDTEISRLMQEKDQCDLEIATLKQEMEELRKAYESTQVSHAKNDMDQKDLEIIAMKQELEMLRKAYEQRCLETEHQKDNENKQVSHANNDVDQKDLEIIAMKQELEMLRKAYEQRCLETEHQKDNENTQVSHTKNDVDQKDLEIIAMKQELEMLRKAYEQRCLETEHQRDNENTQVKDEMDQKDLEISRLKQELESVKSSYEQICMEMESRKDNEDKQISHIENEVDENNAETSRLKQELESVKRSYEQRCQDMEQRYLEMERRKDNMEKEKDKNDPEISRLKQELESAKRSYEQHCQDAEQRKIIEEEELSRMMKAKDQSDNEISTLKQELEACKKTYESRCQELETGAKLVKSKLEQELKQREQLLEDAINKTKQVEENAKLKSKAWMRKEHVFQNFISNHGTALQELRSSSEATKMELVKAQKSYLQDLSRTGETFKGLAATAEKYHQVMYENRKIYNELQDLKGNIRVYCRIRPFLKGQTKKDTVIDTIGEYGELTVINPSKGKESQKSFKFNKVFSPTSTQEEVFKDTQPLVRTILDGFNVCIFAYGQTGSGKTYTMTGPEGANKNDWGVNYRALDDLFQISEQRKNQFHYVIGVQMVEIYNEQILDLLTSDSSQKKLGVLTGSQPNGIAVPDASMHTVQSTSDVIELMSLGHANRTVSSTAMNERSSRSHSVVTIHVQGTDLKSGAITHASLHLVDLAGSERIDRSEVTGDRLREAQHINKSLSALGDVIFALAAKSNHVPYRNSKLTQVLQSSLGGRAKTLMFVQLNPDVTSFSETLSTLKFAERVSGVELGAARNNKEGRDVKELADQVESLKDTIAKKDEEIERLQLLKDPRSTNNSGLPSRRSANSLANNGSQSPTSTDHEDFIDRNSDSGSTQLTDNEERLSEGSDGDLPVATDADGAFETKETPKASKTSKNPDASLDKTRMGKLASPRSRVVPPTATPASRLSQVKTTVRAATALRKAGTGTSSSSATPARPSSIASSSPRTPSTHSRRPSS